MSGVHFDPARTSHHRNIFSGLVIKAVNTVFDDPKRILALYDTKLIPAPSAVLFKGGGSAKIKLRLILKKDVEELLLKEVRLEAHNEGSERLNYGEGLAIRAFATNRNLLPPKITAIITWTRPADANAKSANEKEILDVVNKRICRKAMF